MQSRPMCPCWLALWSSWFALCWAGKIQLSADLIIGARNRKRTKNEGGEISCSPNFKQQPPTTSELSGQRPEGLSGKLAWDWDWEALKQWPRALTNLQRFLARLFVRSSFSLGKFPTESLLIDSASCSRQSASSGQGKFEVDLDLRNNNNNNYSYSRISGPSASSAPNVLVLLATCKASGLSGREIRSQFAADQLINWA